MASWFAPPLVERRPACRIVFRTGNTAPAAELLYQERVAKHKVKNVHEKKICLRGVYTYVMLIRHRLRRSAAYVLVNRSMRLAVLFHALSRPRAKSYRYDGYAILANDQPHVSGTVWSLVTVVSIVARPLRANGDSSRYFWIVVAPGAATVVILPGDGCCPDSDRLSTNGNKLYLRSRAKRGQYTKFRLLSTYHTAICISVCTASPGFVTGP